MVSSRPNWRSKYISWRARFDMRLEVLSRLSIRLPFRWSFARRSSVSGGGCFMPRNSSTTTFTSSRTAPVGAPGVDGELAGIAVGHQVAEDGVRQPALLAHVLEQPRAHRAAQHRVEHVGGVPVVVILRVGTGAEQHVALLQILGAHLRVRAPRPAAVPSPRSPTPSRAPKVGSTSALICCVRDVADGDDRRSCAPYRCWRNTTGGPRASAPARSRRCPGWAGPAGGRARSSA